MNNRLSNLLSIISTALLLVVLAGVAVLVLVRPAAAQDGGVPDLRQVTVNGVGQAQATPDTATVQIGVETDAPTAQEALRQNNERMQAMLAQLKDLGVEPKDIQTSNLAIYPNYNAEGRVVSGYRVSNMVSVTIRDLANAGMLLDAVVQAGANSLYGISFSVSDPAAAMEQARAQAMQDARTRAEQLATAGGAGIGRVLLISEGSAVQPVPYRGAPMMADSAASVPVEPGQQTMSVSVTVTFELR